MNMNYGDIISHTELYVQLYLYGSLPNSVVNKDKFWSMHDCIYDYRANPLAVGSQV